MYNSLCCPCTSVGGQLCATVQDFCNSNAPQIGSTVTVKQSVLTSLTLNNGGTGYTNGLNRALGFSALGLNAPATGLFDVVGGSITNVRLTAGGSYINTPTVTFPGAGTGTGGSVTATMTTNTKGTCVTTGQISAINVTNAATNGPYPTAPNVSVSGGSGAVATANRTGGVVSGTLTVTAGGSNYTAIPGVTITDAVGNGTGATAAARMGMDAATIGAGGTGYTVGDVLTVSGGTATTTAQFTVSAVSGGVIVGVSVSRAGVYSALPASSVSITGGTGTGANFNPTWKVVTLVLGVGGSLYGSPVVNFTGGGGGSGAAATATATTIRVNSIAVVNGGSNFGNTATVTVGPAASGGTTATATATVIAQCCVTGLDNGTYTAYALNPPVGYAPRGFGAATISGGGSASTTIQVAKYYAQITGCGNTGSCGNGATLSGATVTVSQNGIPVGSPFTTDANGDIGPIPFPLDPSGATNSAVISAPRFNDQTFATLGTITCTAPIGSSSPGSLGSTSAALSNPLSGYVCFGTNVRGSCPLPLKTTLVLTDSMYGTVNLIYQGGDCGANGNYVGTLTVNYPGFDDCAAAPGLVLTYTFNWSASSLSITYVADSIAVNLHGQGCPGGDGLSSGGVSPGGVAGSTVLCPPGLLFTFTSGGNALYGYGSGGTITITE